MRYKILTENGMGNTNIDGARAEHFNAGMRDGIVKGAFNEGTFTTLASNQISFDTCELRISGHRVLIEEAWSSTFSTRPKTPTRFAVIGEITVGEDSSVQFDLFAQLATTALIKNNLFKQQNGAGTYQVEIGRFTLNTDGNIIDVARTLDIITGSRAEDLDGTINIGNITTNTLNPGMEAEFDVEQRYDPEQEKVVTDFTVGIPQGEKGLTAEGVEELIAGKADLRNPSQSINANSLSLSSLDENYVASLYLTGFSEDYATITMTSNGLEFRTFDAGNDRNNAAMMFKGATFIQMVAGSIDLRANSGQIRLETSTTADSYLTVNELLTANKGITAVGNITINGEKALTQSSLLNLVYPVGSIYMSVNNVSPETFLGGSWVAWGQGRVPVGVGDNGENNYTEAEQEGGSDNSVAAHTHEVIGTTAREGTHQHIIWGNNRENSGDDCVKFGKRGAAERYQFLNVGENTHPEDGAHEHRFNTMSNSTGTVGGNRQAFITCYMWKRTA